MRKRPLPKFPERDRRWPGKKNTRRWCKGVVGREHQPQWVRHEYEFSTGGTRKIIWLWNEKVCQVCSKRLEYDFKKVQKTDERRRKALQKRIQEQKKLKALADRFTIISCAHKIPINKHCKECNDAIGPEFWAKPENMELLTKVKFGLPLAKEMIQATIWVKPYHLMRSCYPIDVLLPQDKLASKVESMRQKGFWCVDQGEIVWYNPDSVLEVRLKL